MLQQKGLFFLSIICVFFSYGARCDQLNVGLCMMATGKYTRFIKPLIESADKYFFVGHNITYFVFTDGEIEYHPHTVVLHQKRLGWPYDSMMRFEAYYKYKEELEKMDYLFALDADMLFEGKVDVEILGERVAVLHPGFYNKPRTSYSYETNPASTAYIASHEGEHYFCGGFWGGSATEFLNICARCLTRIYKDIEHNIVAVWHDESHRNRDAIDYPPTKILDPSYCYPEHQHLVGPFSRKIVALDKNHEEMREDNDV
jgi:histo-blood group ABO system transferase